MLNGVTLAYGRLCSENCCCDVRSEAGDGVGNAGGGPGGAGNCHDITGNEEVVLVETDESGTSSRVSICGAVRVFLLVRCDGFSSSESVVGEEVGLMDPARSICDTGLEDFWDDAVSGLGRLPARCLSILPMALVLVLVIVLVLSGTVDFKRSGIGGTGGGVA